MGRGRAKAKQTKVARNLKYNSAPSMDLNRLQRDLHADDPLSTYQEPAPDTLTDDSDDEDEDPYARFVESDEDSAAS